jgi:hypothetical protein
MANVANPTPKERFLAEQTNVDQHKRLLDLPAFERGCSVAFSEYSRRCAANAGDNMNSAALAGLQLSGAAQFLSTLRNLAENSVTQESIYTDNLDHTV